MTYFSYKHHVSLEETNLVGNVYFTNHLRWQGLCREKFLMERAPDILSDLERNLALVTVKCSCDYFAELGAFDQIEIRMRLKTLSRNQIGMDFEYRRLKNGVDELVAKGYQQVACMKRDSGNKNGGLEPTVIPASLKDALEPFR